MSANNDRSAVSETNDSASTETVTSSYRVLGLGDDGSIMLVFDLERDASIWVTRTGYSDDVQEVLDSIEPGNKLFMTIAGVPGSEEPWEVVEADKMTDETVAFVPTGEYVPGQPTSPLDGSDGDDEYAIGVFEDDETGEVLVELQVHPQEFDGIDLWEHIRTGQLSLEPWFDELDTVADGAHTLYVINPKHKSFIAFLGFPEGSDLTPEIQQNIKTYLEEHDDLGEWNLPPQ